jgi:hypothetical protein
MTGLNVSAPMNISIDDQEKDFNTTLRKRILEGKFRT